MGMPQLRNIEGQHTEAEPMMPLYTNTDGGGILVSTKNTVIVDYPADPNITTVEHVPPSTDESAKKSVFLARSIGEVGMDRLYRFGVPVEIREGEIPAGYERWYDESFMRCWSIDETSLADAEAYFQEVLTDADEQNAPKGVSLARLKDAVDPSAQKAGEGGGLFGFAKNIGVVGACVVAYAALTAAEKVISQHGADEAQSPKDLIIEDPDVLGYHLREADDIVDEPAPRDRE
jgi:hypothetical protein